MGLVCLIVMVISVKVKFGSDKREIEKIDETNYIVFLKERPVKGKANKEMLQLLEKYFNKNAKIISGKTLSKKLVKIE